MRNKRWQLEFTTLQGNRAVISIYKEGYNGTAFDILYPAAVPFETEEDSGEDILEPVRGHTGYLRVVDKDGTAWQLLPEDNRQHYLELTVNGAVKWCGYIQAAVYTEGWESCPREVSFSVASGLAVLESEQMEQTNGFGIVNFAGFVVEAINASGVSYERLYIPEEFKTSAQTSDYCFPLMCSCSRYNFFSRTEAMNTEDPEWKEYEGRTYREMLEAWCKLWGWSLRERGKYLYLVSANTNKYRYFSASELQTMAAGTYVYGTTYTAPEANMATMVLDGADNTRDIIPGKRKIIVKATVNAVGDVLPVMNIDSMKFVWADNWASAGSTFKFRAAYFTPQDERIKTYLYSFTGAYVNEFTGTPSQVDSLNNPAGRWYQSFGGVFPIKEDTWVTADEQKKKNYDYKDYFRIVRYVKNNNVQGSGAKILSADTPVMVLRSSGVASYESGALNLRASLAVWLTDLWDLQKVTTVNTAYMRFKLQFGDKFWDGSGWTTSDTKFNVFFADSHPVSESSDTSKFVTWHDLATNKNLNQPYNGAEMQIMPITSPMSGEIVLTVYAGYWPKVDGYDYNFAIKDLEIKYVPEDWTYGANEDRKQTINYYALVGTYREEQETALAIHSENGNGAAYSNLLSGASAVKSLYSVPYSAAMRPENALLGTLKRINGRNIEKLSIQFEHADLTPCVMMERNGKRYYNISEKVNWCDDSALYILEDVPQIENA